MISEFARLLEIENIGMFANLLKWRRKMINTIIIIWVLAAHSIIIMAYIRHLRKDIFELRSEIKNLIDVHRTKIPIIPNKNVPENTMYILSQPSAAFCGPQSPQYDIRNFGYKGVEND